MTDLQVAGDFMDELATKLSELAGLVDPRLDGIVDYTITGSATVEMAAETAQASQRARAAQVSANLVALSQHASAARIQMDAVDESLAPGG